jgi:hypothetical protein
VPPKLALSLPQGQSRPECDEGVDAQGVGRKKEITQENLYVMDFSK